MTATQQNPSPDYVPPTNDEIASALAQIAELLENQGANPFRVKAYRRAAETIHHLRGTAHLLLRIEGIVGLIRLPGIGNSLAHAIEHFIRDRRMPLLERLRGENVPERVFATVPDIGPELAKRIHERLGIETLFELEAAAHDGRLAQVPGMGSKRVRAVRESLAGRFQHLRGERPRTSMSGEAAVREILDVDEEYRRLAAEGRLPRIAPRRFNPEKKPWLPVLHTIRDGRHYTALYSNTARAHEMGSTHDWVVIYRDDDGDHGRWTVITAHFGKLRGRRIVRGREQDCELFYAESREQIGIAPVAGPPTESADLGNISS